jgi:hypothetical protein
MSQSKFWRFLVWLGVGQETLIDDVSQLVRVGRDEYKYLEGERSLLVQIDMLRGKPSKMLYSSTIGPWLPPHQDEPVTEADRSRIANKIADFLTRHGESVVIK